MSVSGKPLPVAAASGTRGRALQIHPQDNVLVALVDLRDAVHDDGIAVGPAGGRELVFGWDIGHQGYDLSRVARLFAL